MLPILFRAPEEERDNITSANNLQIWSPAAGRGIPLRGAAGASDAACVPLNEGR